MPSFWQAIPEIKEQFGESYHAFSLFGQVHLCELGFCAALDGAAMYAYRRVNEAQRHRILWIITVLLLADELIKHIAMIATGQWSWIYLPLHLCSINIFVCLWHTARGSTLAKEILYSLCLPGAVLALLCPSWQPAPVWNIMHLHSASVHILLFIYPCLLLAGGFRPDFRRFPKVCAFLFATAIPIFFINKALGTNFYFLSDPNANAITRAFAAVLGDKYFYWGFLAAFCLLAVVLYLPWAISERRSKRAEYLH